jgi:hypothetical protein
LSKLLSRDIMLLDAAGLRIARGGRATRDARRLKLPTRSVVKVVMVVMCTSTPPTRPWLDQLLMWDEDDDNNSPDDRIVLLPSVRSDVAAPKL